jgi:hypothetical protein
MRQYGQKWLQALCAQSMNIRETRENIALYGWQAAHVPIRSGLIAESSFPRRVYSIHRIFSKRECKVTILRRKVIICLTVSPSFSAVSNSVLVRSYFQHLLWNLCTIPLWWLRRIACATWGSPCPPCSTYLCSRSNPFWYLQQSIRPFVRTIVNPSIVWE